MKVLHMISGGDSGGAKTHVFSLMSALPKMCDVKIVCFIKGQFFDELQDIDVQSELIEQKSRFDLSVLSRLCEIINTDDIDIVHAHGARANFIASNLKKKVNIPVVTTVHSDYLLDFDTFYKKLIFTTLNVMSLKKLDYYIAVSSNFKSMLISRGFKPSTVYTVYNGMDYSAPFEYCSKEEFAKRIGLDYNPQTTYIGLIGRHDKVKGHDVFIKGAAKVLESRKNVHFVIAGDGAGREELVKLAQSLGISENITFAGFIKDIYSFINFIDINTLTSLCESFPYVLMEGARLKKPTVSSEVGGIPDLIEDGVTGFLFKSKDHNGLASKLIKLVDSVDLRENLGDALYERATNNFSNESLAKSHVDIYNAILRDRKDPLKYDAVLSGYYGFHNSGDDALLQGIIESLKKEQPNIRLLILSRRPKETANLIMTDTVQRFNPFSVRKALKNSHMLITGGGSLIQDTTSDKSLAYYLYVIKQAHKYNKLIYVYANGIGPLSEKNVPVAANVIQNVDMITLRDEMSVSEIDRMGITNIPVEVTADPAILLKPASKEKSALLLENEAEGLSSKKLLCVSLRNWKENDSAFCQKIAEICDRAYSEHGLTTLFLPMKPPADTKISESCAALMKSKSYILKKSYDVSSILGIVSLCDCAIAMRLHSLIYALTASIPAIGLIYDPKIEGFLKYIESENNFHVGCIDVNGVLETLGNIMENRDSICTEIQAKHLELCKKAYKNAEIAVKLLKDNRHD